MALFPGSNGPDLIFLDRQRFDGVQGAGGDDTIIGDLGSAFGAELLGGSGNDSIVASLSDSLVGAGGDDTLQAGGGNNPVAGGDGNDILLGGLASDTMRGADGDDVVGDLTDALDFFNPQSFGFGLDVLIGADGNDTLTGGAGDTLKGGEGADLFRVVPTLRGDPPPVVASISRFTGDRIEFIGLPDVPDGFTVRVRGVDVAPGDGVLCEVLAQYDDGSHIFLGNVVIGNALRFGFLDYLDIVNNDAPLV